MCKNYNSQCKQCKYNKQSLFYFYTEIYSFVKDLFCFIFRNTNYLSKMAEDNVSHIMCTSFWNIPIYYVFSAAILLPTLLN